jgi:hypothetical protein
MWTHEGPWKKCANTFWSIVKQKKLDLLSNKGWRKESLLWSNHAYPISTHTMVESPGLACFQGACLPLDTKCPESELNPMILSSTPNGRTQNNPHFTPGIQ